MNVEIKNEAGTHVLATGVTNNFNAPEVEVTNIDHPDRILVDSEYQIGPVGGPYDGMICTAKYGNTAGFKR
ncbi:hypothetical protein [Aquimarina algicola]|uniref:Uncharacterized protein n=1 Tax=Aquimarina algicola TaxID=2589995 RepID=A0A504J9F2_9FLAO|nr:hypothetical protein [Aquimarina algicola]TPN85142.1 hypothetical protein FHK87_14010 [Aquimarina algicola]